MAILFTHTVEARIRMEHHMEMPSKGIIWGYAHRYVWSFGSWSLEVEAKEQCVLGHKDSAFPA